MKGQVIHMENNIDRALDWDDTIEKESSDFVLLPEGDYNYVVESFQRGRHNGSDKLPPCPKAILKIRIESEKGTALITHNLFLHTKTEGMLSAFFESIGQKKKGEKISMNWNLVTGATGLASIGVHEYKNKDGEDRKSNQIKKFYPKEEKPAFTAGTF